VVGNNDLSVSVARRSVMTLLSNGLLLSSGNINVVRNGE